MFRKKVNKTITNVDKIVTGLIIGGALASIFGASKTSAWKSLFTKWASLSKRVFNSWHNLVWKGLLKVISIFKRKN